MEIETSLESCNSEALTALTGTTLLTEEDMEKYRACLSSIEHAFFHVQMFRTPTEMIVSVLNDVSFPTVDSKYWQAVREMNVMAENLIMLSFTYNEKLLDLECLEFERAAIADDNNRKVQIEIERKNIAINRKKFEIASIQREAHHRIREIDQWKGIQDELLPRLSGGTEDVNCHQLFSYTIRFLQEYRIAETGHVNKDLDSYRNLKSHVISSLATIERAGLTSELVKILNQDPELVNFIRKQKLISV